MNYSYVQAVNIDADMAQRTPLSRHDLLCNVLPCIYSIWQQRADLAGPLRISPLDYVVTLRDGCLTVCQEEHRYCDNTLPLA